MKISAILKGRPDQFKRVPIVIRIADGDKRRYIATDFRIEPARFTNGLTDDPDLNAKLKKLVLNHEMALLDDQQKYPDANFFAYVAQCMKEWDKKRAYNTMRNYNAETNKLRAFRSSFKLSDVTPAFLTAYNKYLSDLGNIANTQWTSFKFIRTIILKAKRERIIEYNPFDIFKLPAYRDPEKTYLTKEEVTKIEKYIPEAGANKFCATWFVIGCYTGLRYVDMHHFDKDKHIRAGRLVVRTIKTKETISMPLSSKVKKLFESIQYQPMFISNQKYNSALKKIGEKLGIGHITVHSSRHTFATMCAEAGISQEVTARLLGHRSLKATQIYYKITNPRIDKEVKRLG